MQDSLRTGIMYVIQKQNGAKIDWETGELMQDE